MAETATSSGTVEIPLAAAVERLREAGWSLTRTHVCSNLEELRTKTRQISEGGPQAALGGRASRLAAHVHVRFPEGGGNPDQCTFELEERVDLQCR